VQAELHMGTGLVSVKSLNPARIPTHFTASKEIILTSPNSPYLILSLFLSVLTQKLPLLFFMALANAFGDSYLLTASLNSLAVFLWPAPPFFTSGTGGLYLNSSLETACCKTISAVSVKVFLSTGSCVHSTGVDFNVSSLSGIKYQLSFETFRQRW